MVSLSICSEKGGGQTHTHRKGERRRENKIERARERKKDRERERVSEEGRLPCVDGEFYAMIYPT